MIIGYARVSTRGQARDGNSLEYQEEQLRSAGAEKIYYDTYTGKVSERPELDKLTVKKSWQDMASRGGVCLLLAQMRALANSAAKKAVEEAGKKGIE